jgi:hypothetical protein
MSKSVAQVFISATSGDLAGAREHAANALAHTCHPLWQNLFLPDYRSLEESLRATIKDCHSMLHLVGFRYGAEPRDVPAGKPRRSYTQTEYDVAKELGKPVYVFLMDESFPFDQAKGQPEDAERTQLQREHREKLKKEHKYEVIRSLAELRDKVLVLPIARDWGVKEVVDKVRLSLLMAVAMVVCVAGGAYGDRVASRPHQDTVAMVDQQPPDASAASPPHTAGTPAPSPAPKPPAHENPLPPAPGPALGKNSFLAGMAGGYFFLLRSIIYGLTPPDATAGGVATSGHRSVHYAGMGILAMQGLDDPSEDPRTKKSNSSGSASFSWLFSSAHWSNAVAHAWTETWGNGDSYYRGGFICGLWWSILVLFAPKKKIPAQPANR